MAAGELSQPRDELTVHPGPTAADGGPTWILHDPVSNRFFRLSWPAFEILSRWHLGEAGAIAAAVRADTGLAIEDRDVFGLATFLGQAHLLHAASPAGTDRLIAAHDAARISWSAWLLHHYLFFRIPLVRPDALLSRTLPWVAWLGGRAFRVATLAALLAGLVLVGRQWDHFAATFIDHVSPTGLAAFAVALGAAKIIHELGHAFVAKAFGCRVPTMGIAFLVLWPMLYTDVNEAWTLADRRRRLLIGGAGILAELALAAWATLAWAILPDGPARSMAFVLAATTWISSLLINLGPFMRFDGYFLAMDALDQPNLHPRSFALARWHLRETLFGLGEPPPEPLAPASRRWMILFAWCVWIYRLILFLGIAVLVYHVFIKVLGVLLFAVEIGWFVIRPVGMEVMEWWHRRGTIRRSRRAALSAGIALALIAVAAIPWNGRVAAPAVLKAAEHAVLYPPSPGMVGAIEAAEGGLVAAGTVLARLDNPDIVLRQDQVDRRIAVLRYELGAIGFDPVFLGRVQAITEELGAALAERAALAREIDRLILTAPIDGIVTDLSPDVQTGQWIGPSVPVLAVRRGAVVEAYVAEQDVPRFAIGAAARFIPEGGGAIVPASVESIDRVAVRSLTEPILAVPYGGTIPARFDRQTLVPDGALYRVRLRPGDPVLAVAVPERGEIHIDGDRVSPLGRAMRAVVAVVIREWGP